MTTCRPFLGRGNRWRHCHGWASSVRGPLAPFSNFIFSLAGSSVVMHRKLAKSPAIVVRAGARDATHNPHGDRLCRHPHDGSRTNHGEHRNRSPRRADIDAIVHVFVFDGNIGDQRLLRHAKPAPSVHLRSPRPMAAPRTSPRSTAFHPEGADAPSSVNQRPMALRVKNDAGPAPPLSTASCKLRPREPGKC